MKKLPNGLVVFNGTPHSIRFWTRWWGEPVEVETDEVISALVEESVVYPPAFLYLIDSIELLTFVRPIFKGTPEGEKIAREALEAGADVVIGSIIAAQAYPGLVVAMTPAPGFERVPPEQKRMQPDRFTIFAPNERTWEDLR